MKIVPAIKSSDLERSVRFYTEVLDFEWKWPGNEDREKANGVAHLIEDGPFYPRQDGTGRLRHGQCEVVCRLGEFHRPVVLRQPRAGSDLF